MKRILFILLILFIPSLTWGAVYYVSLSGSNTAPYDTWAKAANQIKTVIDYIRTNGTGSNTIYLSAGIYNSSNDYFYLDNTRHSTLTIIGAGKDITIVYPGSSNDTIYGASASSVTFQDLTVIAVSNKRALYTTSTAKDWSFEKVNFISDSSHNNYLLSLSSTSKINFNKCVFKYKYSSTYYMTYISGSSNGSFNYSIFIPLESNGYSKCIQFYNFTGTFCINNCVILGSYNRGIYMGGTGTGTVNVNNCIVWAWTGNSVYKGSTAGTMNVKNTLAIGSSNYPLTPLSGVNIDENNIKNNSDPRFRIYNRMGFIVPRVDDMSNYSYARSLEPLFQSYGVKGVYFFNSYYFNNPDWIDNIRGMLNAGVFEVGNHGYTHSRFTNTQAYSITKSGATINVDRANNKIVITPGGTVDEFKTKTLNQIKSELQSLGCTVGIYPTDLSGNTLGEGLADSGGPQPSPYTPSLLLDTSAQTGFYKVEMADSRLRFNSVLGDMIDPQTGDYYNCTSFAHPYTDFNDNTITAVMNSGHKSNSIGDNILYSTAPQLDLFRLRVMGANTALKDITESLVRQRARAIGFAVKQGMIVQVLSHNESQLSAEQWGWCLDEWINEMGIPPSRITSMQLVAKYIKESGLWTYEGNGIYTRTFEDDDYRLQKDSPCIDEGIDVGLTEDFEGKKVPWGEFPDIGAYEYYPPCEGDFDNDGDVDGSDLAVFAADFGRTNCNTPGAPPCKGDFDHDGDVDGSDLAIFASDFGRKDCPNHPDSY